MPVLSCSRETHTPLAQEVVLPLPRNPRVVTPLRDILRAIPRAIPKHKVTLATLRATPKERLRLLPRATHKDPLLKDRPMVVDLFHLASTSMAPMAPTAPIPPALTLPAPTLLVLMVFLTGLECSRCLLDRCLLDSCLLGSLLAPDLPPAILCLLPVTLPTEGLLLATLPCT